MTPFTNARTGWHLRRLDEVCEVNPRRDLTGMADGLVISKVPMAAVEERTGRLDPSERVTLGEVKGKSLTHFREGDIVVAKISPSFENGKVAIAAGLASDYAVGTTELIVLRPHDELDRRYLLHILLSPDVRMPLASTFSGTVGQQRISQDEFRAIRIPVPPLAEQHAIVETIERMLSRLDAGRDNTLTARRRLELLQAAVDSHATYGQLHDVKGDRNDALAIVAACCGNRDPKSILSAPVPDDLTVPDTWVWSSIDELADVQAGAAKSKKLEGAEGCVERPYLSVANVQRGKLALDDVKTMWVRSSKLDDLMLRPGDVLFNEGGDKDKLGRGSIWEGQVKDCVHQNHVFRARLRSEGVDPRWLSHWGNVFGRWWFHARGSQTTGIASINKAVLRSLPVPVPPLVEQQAILAELDRRGAEIEHAVQTIETATLRAAALRRSILKASFEGRLTSTAVAPSADGLQEKIA